MHALTRTHIKCQAAAGHQEGAAISWVPRMQETPDAGEVPRMQETPDAGDPAGCRRPRCSGRVSVTVSDPPATVVYARHVRAQVRRRQGGHSAWLAWHQPWHQQRVRPRHRRQRRQQVRKLARVRNAFLRPRYTRYHPGSVLGKRTEFRLRPTDPFGGKVGYVICF